VQFQYQSGALSFVMFLKVRKYLPLFFLCLLLLLTGIGIYRKTRLAVAPPIYDGIEYYMKAGNVWAALKSGHFGNLMEVSPAFRPPGTALLLYPFGFTPAFQWMLFRVTFLPIVAFIVAFWMVADPLARDMRSRWLNFGVAAALASLPLFYQFEYNAHFYSPVWWGLMDTPIAALSALALAFLLSSVSRRRIGMALCGGGLTAFTLLVKPVGLFLIPLILWHWVVEIAVANWPAGATWRNDRQFRRYVVVTVLASMMMTGAVVFVSVKSSYVSPGNVQFAAEAMKYVRSAQVGDLLSHLHGEIHYSLGLHGLALFIIVALGIVACTAWHIFRRQLTRDDARLCAGLFAFLGGVTWWFVLPGTLCRYMFPFVFVFFVAAAPRLAARVSKVSPVAHVMFVAGGTLSFCFTSFLLFMNQPPVPWQKWSGLNLSSGGFRQEVALADFICDDATQQKRRLMIYSTGNGCVPGVVQATVIQRSYQNPGSYGADVVTPMDWKTGPVYRRERLTGADYILFHPTRDPRLAEALRINPAVADFETENALLDAWITTASAPEGVEQVPLDGGTLRLARITSRGKFDAAYGEFVRRYQWRAVFAGVNGTQHFFTKDELPRILAETRVKANPVRFGGRFILDAVDFQAKGNGFRLRMVWESAATQSLDCEVAVHLVDESGKILAHANFMQRVDGGSVGAGDVWVDEVELPAEKLTGAVSVGLALAHYPGPDLLPPDSGPRDWNDQRLLIPLPSSVPVPQRQAMGKFAFP
jgi:hypothetical protein